MKIECPSCPSRGNNRERIFWDDDDYAVYLDLCRRYKERDY